MSDNNLKSNREKIADRLKKARVLSGLSQQQVAEALKIQRPSMSEIEAGRRKVSAEEIIKFANLYCVDPAWLLLKENDNESATLQFAARELQNFSEEEIKKILDIVKILPK